eukprot:jgi/Chlat1/1635/Chrsp127S01881
MAATAAATDFLARARLWEGEGGDVNEDVSALDAARRGSLGALVHEDWPPGREARLLAEAQALDARVAAGDVATLPLLGWVVGVKDLVHVAGMPTRAGSSIPPEDLAGPEAQVVTRLRAAGALLVKCATTELGHFAPVPGARNPRAPGRTPGGSSCGPAAAVAAGLCRAAVGTQTVGSVSRPAAYCAVVGFKPTQGRIPTSGLVPLAPSLDHVGLLARNVDDLTQACAAVGINAHEVEAADCGEVTHSDVDMHLFIAGYPVLGIPCEYYLSHCEPEALTHFHATLHTLQGQGWTICPTSILQDFDEVQRRHRVIHYGEFAQEQRELFPRHGQTYRMQTAEVIREGQNLLRQEGVLQRAREARVSWMQELDKAFKGDGSEGATYDMLIAPAATGPPPKGFEATGSPIMALPWTHSGLPTITLPSGVIVDNNQELPVAMTLVGRRGGDEALLRAAAAVEGCLKARVPEPTLGCLHS